MRILVIHQYYLRPEQGGGARFNDMTRRWADAGHEVHVLAGQVHYASGARHADYAGRWLVRERDGAVSVWRAYTPPSFHRGFVGRAAAFIGFAVGATAALARLPRPDVIIASSPSLLTLIPGLLGARAFGAPMIFDVRDLWPESAITTGVLKPHTPLARLLYALEARGYQDAARVVAVSPGIARDILTRGLAPHVEVIPTGAALLAEDGATPQAPPDWAGKFVALYAGAHGLANGLDVLLEVAAILRERADILIVAAGDGPERARLMRLSEDRALENLAWMPPVDRATMRALWRAASCGLVVLRDVPTFRTVYPNKLFDAMATARPVVCAVAGEASALVERAGAGLCVPPQDAPAIASAILTLADDPERARTMGAAGHALVTLEFDRARLAARYLELITEVAHATSRSAT